MSKNQSIYFRGLTGIRAVAALTVVVWHTDMFLDSFKLEQFGLKQTGLAGYAVNLFFVLSGFLITYLLMVEKEKTGTIDVKKFYLRRILRIWPLYYFSILLSFVLCFFEIINLPDSPIFSYFLYFFLLANVSYAIKISVTTITPLWSVGVEEQFYAIWPWIIKFSNKITRSLLFVIIIYFSLKSIVWLYNPQSYLYSFVSHARIDLMALGGLGAYIIKNDISWLKNIIFSKYMQLISWLVVFYSVIVSPIHLSSFLDDELNSIFYLIIILNVSSNKKTLISLENKVLKFFGEISYGIYIYHMIVIALIIKYFDSDISGLGYFSLIVPLIVILFTSIMAYLSYKYIEKPILRQKKNYEVVKSSVNSD